jgi:hypothetical protein
MSQRKFLTLSIYDIAINGKVIFVCDKFLQYGEFSESKLIL